MNLVDKVKKNSEVTLSIMEKVSFLHKHYCNGKEGSSFTSRVDDLNKEGVFIFNVIDAFDGVNLLPGECPGSIAYCDSNDEKLFVVFGAPSLGVELDIKNSLCGVYWLPGEEEHARSKEFFIHSLLSPGDKYSFGSGKVTFLNGHDKKIIFPLRSPVSSHYPYEEKESSRDDLLAKLGYETYGFIDKVYSTSYSEVDKDRDREISTDLGRGFVKLLELALRIRKSEIMERVRPDYESAFDKELEERIGKLKENPDLCDGLLVKKLEGLRGEVE